MYEGVVVLGCVAIAAGLGVGAYRLARRHAAGWTTTLDVPGGAFRGGRVVLGTREPRVVLASAGASVLGAGTSLLRGALALFHDVVELADEPHIELGLVPRVPWLAVLTALYALVSLAAFGVFLSAAWRVRTPHGARQGIAAIASVVVLPFAMAHAWMVATTCASIYWTRGMIALSVGHAALVVPALVLGALAARAARPRS